MVRWCKRCRRAWVVAKGSTCKGCGWDVDTRDACALINELAKES